jgi:hypothetical protein
MSFVLTMVTAAYADVEVFGPGSKLKWIVLLAPLPGTFALIRTSLGFNQRAAWFSEKATRLNTVRRRYVHDIINKTQAIYDATTIDMDMEGRWRPLLLRLGAGSQNNVDTKKKDERGEDGFQ